MTRMKLTALAALFATTALAPLAHAQLTTTDEVPAETQTEEEIQIVASETGDTETTPENDDDTNQDDEDDEDDDEDDDDEDEDDDEDDDGEDEDDDEDDDD